MPDIGHEQTDKLLAEMEKKVAHEYNQARKEVQAKLNKYMADFAEEDERKRKLLQEGKITKKDYQDWRLRKMAMGKRWEEMRDNLAQDYHNANNIARSIAQGYKPEVYALNHNYATYQVEHDGGIDSFYSMYDKQTVERLLREDQILMPDPSPQKAAKIAANKDMQWNKQQLQSALTQSILQGESIPQMARRISQAVAVKNYNSAVRYARTMATSAQNAGRYDAYRRAKDMGIDLTIEWSATLDHRTRHDHRMMHGQRTTVDEPFLTPDGYRIYYPADCTGESNAPQKEIWNCRCTLLAWVKGFERDTVKESPKMGDMTFEEWQNDHGTSPEYKMSRNETSDREQYAEYKKLLKKDAPKSFDEFQQIKYYDHDEWSQQKAKARQVRNSTQYVLRSGALNPDSTRAKGHAKRYYESVRKMTGDVKRIAKNTGYNENDIQEVKNYIFMEKHDLGNGKPEYFVPSYQMAESWQRLIDGKNIQKHDYTLLDHEIHERNLMKQGYTQDDAHIITSRIFNYHRESDEYYDKIKRDKKK
jgi:SPP1 gp7 family putative phage head morphogenesis protein